MMLMTVYLGATTRHWPRLLVSRSFMPSSFEEIVQFRTRTSPLCSCAHKTDVFLTTCRRLAAIGYGLLRVG